MCKISGRIFSIDCPTQGGLIVTEQAIEKLLEEQPKLPVTINFGFRGHGTTTAFRRNENTIFCEANVDTTLEKILNSSIDSKLFWEFGVVAYEKNKFDKVFVTDRYKLIDPLYLEVSLVATQIARPSCVLLKDIP